MYLLKEEKNFELRIPCNKNIYENIINNLMIFESEYKLIGIICTPEYELYNAIIVCLLKILKS